MPRWRTVDVQCDDCGRRDIVLLDLSDPADQPDPCPNCSGFLSQQLAAPAVLNASYPDGMSRGEGYELLKRASKVEKEMVNLRHEKRGEHRKEIQKLKTLALGKRDKNNN